MLHEFHQPTPDALTGRTDFDTESYTFSKALDVLCLFVLSAMHFSRGLMPPISHAALMEAKWRGH